jgi:hypothetical protein
MSIKMLSTSTICNLAYHGECQNMWYQAEKGHTLLMWHHPFSFEVGDRLNFIEAQQTTDRKTFSSHQKAIYFIV